MLCPVCSLPMIVVERRGIEVDYCLQCHGMWFDSGEIDLLAQALSLPRPDIELHPVQSEEKSRRCPRCDTRMDKVHLGEFHAAIIDSCPHGHGFWFDRGELSAIFDRPATITTPQEEAMITFLGEVLGK